MCIQTGEIVWLNGPFRCGKWPDASIFWRNLKQMLLPDEMVEANHGCLDNKCRHPDVAFNWADVCAKTMARSHHETDNGNLKQFGCLNQMWRHPLERHSVAFGACATLVQLGIKISGPKS